MSALRSGAHTAAAYKSIQGGSAVAERGLLLAPIRLIYINGFKIRMHTRANHTVWLSRLDKRLPDLPVVVLQGLEVTCVSSAS